MEQLRIDLVPMGVTPNAHASQFDVGRVIRFLLYNGGSAYTLAGTETITVKMAKPDGTEETVSVTNTSSNYVDFITTDGLLNQVGLYPCEISITSGADVIGSKNFNLRVELDPYDGHNIRTVTIGPADICTFTTDLPEFFHSLTVNVVATGGNGTPDNPNPIVGYSSANIVNTQNDSIVDLFSIDSDFRGTVNFNQLVQNGNFEDTSIWSAVTANFSTSGNVGKFTATAQNGRISQTIAVLSGHKYLLSGEIKASSNLVGLTGFATFNSNGSGNWEPFSIIVPVTTSGNAYFITRDNRTSDWDEVQMRNYNVFDLTQKFGSTIADYIYTLEQNNAGEGVAFFRSIYPEDFYAFDSGTTEIVGKETPEATIAFGQTVYGGVLHIENGRTWIEVTHAKYTGTWGDGGSEYLPPQAPSVKRRTFTLNPQAPTSSVPNNGHSLCNVTDTYSTANNLDSSHYYVADNLYLYLPMATSDDTVIECSYVLATPFDIDLTPVQIRALVGENNVFADCGQTTVEYMTEE